MPHIHLDPDMASMVELEGVGLHVTRRSRRKGSGKRKKMRRLAGEFQHEREWLLEGITMSVMPGESVAIIGHEDSGRDELLRLVAGTLIPDTGTVRRREVIVPMVGALRALDRSLTVRQNIFVIGGLLGMTPEESESKVTAIAAEAELLPKLDKYIGDARPIVKQKLVWSICMAVEADAYAISQIVVVGNEEFRAHCWERMEARRAAGATFLLASDEPDFLVRFCDRSVVLHDGAIVASTGVAEGLDLLATLPSSAPVRTKRRDEDDDDGEYDEF